MCHSANLFILCAVPFFLLQVFAVAGYKQMSLFQAVNGYPNPLMQADSTDIDAPMVVTTSRPKHMYHLPSCAHSFPNISSSWFREWFGGLESFGSLLALLV